jgi:oligosaccharide repeat unit polymerase
MKKIKDIDKYLIFVLPLLIVLSLAILDDTAGVYAAVMGLAIFSYLVIIYDERLVYGFNGIQILSIPSIIIFTFTIFLAIPSVYICSTNDSHSVFPYFSAHIMFYFLFPLGLKIAGIFKKIDLENLKKIRYAQFHKSNFDMVFFELLMTLLFISFLIFALYIIRVNEIPLFELIKSPGEYIKLNLLREKALKLLEVTIFEDYLFRWQRTLLLPFGIIGSLFLAVTYKRSKYVALFIVFLGAGLFINTLTLEKSPTAGIFLAMMAFYYLMRNRISFKFILISFVLVFVGPILIMVFLHFGKENLFRLIYISFLQRIFLIPAEALYKYFEIFPHIHDFLYGRSTQLFSWIYDQGTFPISNYVAQVWWKDPLTSGYANANYLGNFWADFGWVGIVFSSIAVGMVVHLLYWKILNVSHYKKNVLYVISICILLPVLTFGFFSVNFTVLFFTSGIIVLVFIIIFFKSIMQIIYKIHV